MELKQRAKQTRSEIRYYLRYGELPKNAKYVTISNLRLNKTAIRLNVYNGITICIIDNTKPNVRIWYKTMYADIFRSFAKKKNLKMWRLNNQPSRRIIRNYTTNPTWILNKVTV